MSATYDGHEYGTDKTTGYKTIDGRVLKIDRAPACRGSRKVVRAIIAGFGEEEFTSAGVEAALKAHNKPWIEKLQLHWQVWHEFYQAASKPIDTFGEWYKVQVGNALTGIARDNPELLVRLSVRLASRSRWQSVVSEASFEELAALWAANHPHERQNLEESVAVVAANAASLVEEAAQQRRGFTDGEASPTITKKGVDVVGITLPPPANPYFTAFVRERATYKRIRLRAESRDDAANQVAHSNPGADLIEVFVHEGQLYTYQLTATNPAEAT